jgi:hypothetical protein
MISAQKSKDWGFIILWSYLNILLTIIIQCTVSKYMQYIYIIRQDIAANKLNHGIFRRLFIRILKQP